MNRAGGEEHVSVDFGSGRMVGYSSSTFFAEAQPYAKREFGKVTTG
jgi:hypothetical protein